jgi:DNA-binding NarL/FixJ family response regulator
MSGDLIRVLLADDHAVVRAGLKSVLSIARDIVVVGEASTGREAIALTEQLEPDVVVMDLTMPDLDGMEATKQIVARTADTRVLIVSMHAEDDYLVPAMAAGASGYLVKTDAERELINAIHAVVHGETYIRPVAARAMAKKLAAKDEVLTDKEQYARLTERERNVLRLVGQGYSAPEIGARLLISPKTVDTYKQRIQEKIGLSHRSQFVQFAHRLGLLSAG